MKLTKRIWLAQREDLATHIVLDDGNKERAICGARIGKYPSWIEDVIWEDGAYMNPISWHPKDPLRYIDCLRCSRIYQNATKP